MPIADFLKDIGSGLATTGKAVGSVLEPILERTAQVESGQAPQIDAEARQRKQRMDDAAISAKAQDLESQLEMGRKYGTLTPEQQQQYVSAITDLYSHPSQMDTLVQKLHKAIHPGGATYQTAAPGLTDATPKGGTAAADAEMALQRMKTNYQPYKLSDGSIVNVDLNHERPPDGAVPVQKESTTHHFQLKPVVSKSRGGIVMASYDPQTGKLYDSQKQEITDATNYVKPTNPQMKQGTSGGKNTYAYYNTDQGSWIDSNSGLPIKDFKPLPTYAQTGLYGLDVAYDDSGNAMPVLMNRKTGQVSKAPAGLTAPAQSKNIETARGDAISADARLRTMLGNEKDALKGNQQAMLSLVANHIGMTLGAQKGARINQAVWNEAVETAPWMQAIAAKWGPDGYLQGVTLTPDQIHQMVDLGKSMRQIKWDQAAQTAAANGVQLNVPQFEEHPTQTGAKPGNVLPKTGARPAGATMKVPGSDHKMHWSDGKRDLGVVQ